MCTAFCGTFFIPYNVPRALCNPQEMHYLSHLVGIVSDYFLVNGYIIQRLRRSITAMFIMNIEQNLHPA